MRYMWQGLQKITAYERKASHVVDTYTSLLDELNTFTRFEEKNIKMLTYLPTLTKTPSSVADVSK
jgi:hypothetical protein